MQNSCEINRTRAGGHTYFGMEHPNLFLHALSGQTEYIPYMRHYNPRFVYTANVYRQMTDKLMFNSVISTVR